MSSSTTFNVPAIFIEKKPVEKVGLLNRLLIKSVISALHESSYLSRPNVHDEQLHMMVVSEEFEGKCYGFATSKKAGEKKATSIDDALHIALKRDSTGNWTLKFNETKRKVLKKYPSFTAKPVGSSFRFALLNHAREEILRSSPFQIFPKTGWYFDSFLKKSNDKKLQAYLAPFDHKSRGTKQAKLQELKLMAVRSFYYRQGEGSLLEFLEEMAQDMHSKQALKDKSAGGSALLSLIEEMIDSLQKNGGEVRKKRSRSQIAEPNSEGEELTKKQKVEIEEIVDSSSDQEPPVSQESQSLEPVLEIRPALNEQHRVPLLWRKRSMTKLKDSMFGQYDDDFLKTPNVAAFAGDLLRRSTDCIQQESFLSKSRDDLFASRDMLAPVQEAVSPPSTPEEFTLEDFPMPPFPEFDLGEQIFNLWEGFQ